jgi:Polysaccharide lyase family 4, domain II
MKTAKFLSFSLLIIASSLFAFTFLSGGAVKGTVSPANAALKATAVSDSNVFETNVINGSFQIKNIKPGIYKIIIDASLPYKKTVKDGIEVREGQTTDIGEIRLQE